MTDIIVMCGLPSSGKSTLIAEYSNEAAIVDGDELKTSERVANKVLSLKNCNKTIIIDATNLTLERRSVLIKIAKEWKVPISCIWLTLDAKTCVQRAKERYQKGGKNIPPIAIYKLNKTFIEPTIEEGFNEIIKIN